MICGCHSVTKNRLSYSGIYLLKASQIWISDIDLIIMFGRIHFFVVSFFAVLALSSTELCDQRKVEKMCNLTQWKDNILCRLDGSSENKNGYIQWTSEINSTGSAERKNRFFALVSLVIKDNVLTTCFLLRNS